MSPIYLVTGGTGCIGRQIVRALLDKGKQVRVLTRRQLEGTAAEIEIIHGDLRDQGALQAAVQGAKVIIHAAADVHIPGHRQVYEVSYRINVESTRQLLQLAVRHQVERFIFFSTAGVASPQAWVREAPYVKTKMEAEKVVQAFFDRGEIRTTIVRPSLVFGEGDRGNFGHLIQGVARRRVALIGNGEVLKSVIYSGNVAQAILNILQSEASNGKTYLLSDQRPLTVREIVQTIAAELGSPNQVIPRIPLAVGRIAGRIGDLLEILRIPIPINSRLVKNMICDSVVFSDELTRDTGFCSPIPFVEGVRRTVEWFRAQGLIPRR